MITLNQVIKNLNNIANAHYQINSFGNGSVVEFATSGITNYPAMWVDYEPSQIQGNAYLHVLKIYIMDRLIKGKRNEQELYSDIQQICLDIIAQLNSSIYGWKLVNDNFTLTPKGLKFLYNVYEIKAYAFGVTELEIPYEDLKEILKK